MFVLLQLFLLPSDIAIYIPQNIFLLLLDYGVNIFPLHGYLGEEHLFDFLLPC